jgi:hypothetical protein
MVANEVIDRREAQDDLQHVQTVQLALRLIAPPKSKLAQLIEQRLAELYEKFGDRIDPSLRREVTSFNTDKIIGGDGASLASRDSQSAGSEIPQTVAQAMINPQGQGLGEPSPAASPTVEVAGVDGLTREVGVPKLAAYGRVTKQQQTNLTTDQNAWLMWLSQVLKSDLKRLGLEPDEFADIRILLIKREATEYDKLKLLSRLPDSLAPEAVNKIFDDVRTMAASYVAFILVERAKSRIDEEGDDIAQISEVPASIKGAFYGIPEIDFDPQKLLERLD